jgi:subtilase family serine protease
MGFRRCTDPVPFLGLLSILALSGFSGSALAATRAGSSSAARIVDAVDEAKLVSLAGHTHPLASPQFDKGRVADSLPMEHMFLQLRRSPEREDAFARSIEEQQDPISSSYHQWMTAEEIGERYGVAEKDIATVAQWLTAHGMQVNGVSKNGMTIDVSGTAGQVRDTLHTEIHQYAVNGKTHVANAGDPMVPAAVEPVVMGFVSLHSFLPKPALSKVKKGFSFDCNGCPNGFDGVRLFNEAPADLATIYNVVPLYKAKTPITGKGQTVVVLEDTDINSADVATFRNAFGLTAYTGTFTQIHPGCADPGINAAEGEAALDAEWAGGVAPDAAVQLASCADTLTTFGGFIAAQNLLDLPKPPPIMSLSYIECEASNGPSGNAYVNGLWEQAAAEGVSVFAASGDGAAAGCDDFDHAKFAVGGVAANGLASTPYDVATGGTDFMDTYLGNNSMYWASTNTPGGESAKSYVPEIPWNDSCGSNVLAAFYGYRNLLTFCNSTDGASFLNITGGSGAPSFVYPKPTWQKGIVGMPNDGKRDLPDISLFASNAFWSHAILYCMSDTNEGGAPCDYTNGTDTFFNSAGGTSFTAPQFASIQALINQKAGGPQGDPDPIYYALAKLEFGTSSHPNKSQFVRCNATLGNGVASFCIFHDVTVGNNVVPCYGNISCYGSSETEYGILSASDTLNLGAYPTTTGWDFATGLGSLNVTNLVNYWP